MAALTAAKIVGETADVRRFNSKDAYARHNGTAPLPVWSATANATGSPAPATASSTPRCTASPSPKPATTPTPSPTWTPPRRGDTKTEAIRALKRRLSDVVYRALLTDAAAIPTTTITPAA